MLVFNILVLALTFGDFLDFGWFSKIYGQPTGQRQILRTNKLGSAF